MDLLDPEGARVPISRRTRLAGIKFAPLIPPSKSSAYSHKLASLMQQRNALLGGGGGDGTGNGTAALVAGLAENSEAVKAVVAAMAAANSSSSGSNASGNNNNPFAGLMIGRGKDGNKP